MANEKLKSKFYRDKRGIEFKSLFFAITIASMIIIAVGVIVGEWNTKYNSGIANNLGEYDKLDEVSSIASKNKGDISVKSSSEGEDFEGISIRGAFGVLNNIWTSFNLVFGSGGMVDSVTDRFGLPNYIAQGFITLVIFAVVFTLIAIFFRMVREVA